MVNREHLIKNIGNDCNNIGHAYLAVNISWSSWRMKWRSSGRRTLPVAENRKNNAHQALEIDGLKSSVRKIFTSWPILPYACKVWHKGAYWCLEVCKRGMLDFIGRKGKVFGPEQFFQEHSGGFGM